MTVPAGWTRSFDGQGFPAAVAVAATAAPQLSEADAAANGFAVLPAGAAGSGAASRRLPPVWYLVAAFLALGLCLCFPV